VASAEQTERRRAGARLAVHLGLIATATASLVLEPVITVHVALGLAFCALVVAHLAQRRRVSWRLARRLGAVRRLSGPAGRLALTDALLLAITVGMLVSGFWDWVDGHPTRIRWHAITGIVLAGYLAVHTIGRRRRLTSSHVR
jgi:hypothetical protein